MEWVETSFGRVPIWGDFDSDRPLAFVVRGALPAADQHAELRVPGGDVVLVHLPGFHSPILPTISVDAFARAFDEVITRRFGTRRICVVGVSTGALVAQAMRSPNIFSALLVEPFFSTAKLRPLIELVQRELRSNPEPLIHAWFHAIFGYGKESVVDRDYRHLARIERPTLALVGDVPLEPRRPVFGLPSLTDDTDRALVPHRIVSGGHDVPTEAIASGLAQLVSEMTGERET